MRMKAILLLSVLWGQLQQGPHAVGYTRWDRYDHSRPYRTAKTLDGKPRTGEREQQQESSHAWRM